MNTSRNGLLGVGLCHLEAHLAGLLENSPKVCGELVHSWCVPGGPVVDDLEKCSNHQISCCGIRSADIATISSAECASIKLSQLSNTFQRECFASVFFDSCVL